MCLLSYCRSFAVLFAVFGLLLISCSSEPSSQLLVFYQLQNGTVPSGVAIVQQAAASQNITVDTTSQLAMLEEKVLPQYGAVVFLNVSADTLNVRQQTSVERFVQAGGGLISVASGIAARYTWPWYEGALGLHEAGTVENPERPNMSVELTTLGEGDQPTNGLEVRRQAYDGGRIFALSGDNVSPRLDHADAVDALADGITFAMADRPLDYEQARSLPVPDANRFVKNILVQGPLNEPTELTVLPDGRVVFTERRGGVKLYDPSTRRVKQIAQLDVHIQFEDGLMGIARDPDFYRNHWVYMYYSPAGDQPVQHLSRFLLLGDSLVMSSEKLILTVDVQREQCCHTGGSIAFGPDGHLFLSTGDDTNPFESDGFAPIDERPGRAPFDAQGSSANSQDLRGKVLRIRVKDDATYDIPDGNLFARNGQEGRPEIYTMGTRNSYRISIDQKTGWLYWGDVGNDARVDGPRGPRGYDEINQAKEAGNYGWPYFRGNQAYADYDFATGNVGASYNPNAPVNKSPNNTGMQSLPPFKEALIWYPYNVSPDFPMLGEGGRNAMAGPVYHYDAYPYGSKRLPEYYDNKLFIYDWMRDWIKAVTLDENGNLVRIEPFLDSVEFSHLIDMEMGPNGEMYTLEYGNDWFAANPNAMLARIDYSEGNRTPVARIAADHTIGAPPFTVSFSSEGSFDYDPDDVLNYQWSFDQEEVQSTEPNPTYTFKKPGVYTAQLVLTDQQGDETSEAITIKVGNAPPQVDIALSPSSSFYWPDTPVAYDVQVKDTEDGSLRSGIEPQAVTFSYDFVPPAINSEEDLGHKLAEVDGFTLIENSGCTACHSYEKESVGPAYQQVAARYERNPETVAMLVNKVLNGGKGNWGERAMPAQAVSKEEAQQIISYVLSLDEQKALPLSGTIATENTQNGHYELSATYTDQGGGQIGPLVGQSNITLRHPKVEAEDFANKHNARTRWSSSDYIFVSDLRDSSHIMFPAIDFQNIDRLKLRVSTTAPNITLSINTEDGQKIASVSLPDTQGQANWIEVDVPIQNAPQGRQNLYFITSLPTEASEEALASIDWILFQRASDNRLTTR